MPAYNPSGYMQPSGPKCVLKSDRHGGGEGAGIPILEMPDPILQRGMTSHIKQRIPLGGAPQFPWLSFMSSHHFIGKAGLGRHANPVQQGHVRIALRRIGLVCMSCHQCYPRRHSSHAYSMHARTHTCARNLTTHALPLTTPTSTPGPSPPLSTCYLAFWEIRQRCEQMPIYSAQETTSKQGKVPKSGLVNQ